MSWRVVRVFSRCHGGMSDFHLESLVGSDDRMLFLGPGFFQGQMVHLYLGDWQRGTKVGRGITVMDCTGGIFSEIMIQTWRVSNAEFVIVSMCICL